MFDSFQHAYAFVARGGPVMVPIFLSSLACLTLILERAWVLRRERIIPLRLEEELRTLLSERKTSEAITLCRSHDVSLARITAAGLSQNSANPSGVKDALESGGKKEVQYMERNLDFLAMLAAVAPLLGLLGTVIGIIQAFLVVGAVGLGDPLKLSSGIAEALICTAAGLVVAIPAVVFHRIFLHKVDRLVAELEEFSQRVLSAVGS
jgi:biopolymer transport protein ExbB